MKLLKCPTCAGQVVVWRCDLCRRDIGPGQQRLSLTLAIQCGEKLISMSPAAFDICFHCAAEPIGGYPGSPESLKTLLPNFCFSLRAQAMKGRPHIPVGQRSGSDSKR